MAGRILFILLFIIFIRGSLDADIKLYLQPRTVLGEESLLLRDIALIEGSYPCMEEFENIRIEREIYSDGYIDKKEINDILKKYTEDSIYIYGSAVRIVESDEPAIYASRTGAYLVKRGDPVDVVVKKKGISLTMKGIVASEGRLDEEVSVRVENKMFSSRIIRGMVRGKNLVEINI